MSGMPESAVRIGHRDTVSATDRAWGRTAMQYRETSMPASRSGWHVRRIAGWPARPHPGHPGLAAMLAACVDGDRGRDRDDRNVFGGGLGGLLGQRVSYREVLGLIVIQELTCKEAATVCGCAVGTVRTRMSRARAALKQTFLDQRCSVESPPTRQADVPLAVAVVSPAFGIEGAAPGCSGSARPSAPADTL
jgi:hypothetical protein